MFHPDGVFIWKTLQSSRPHRGREPPAQVFTCLGCRGEAHLVPPAYGLHYLSCILDLGS